MTTPPLPPEGYELYPPDLARKYGAQPKMKWRNRHCPEHAMKEDRK